MLGLEGRSGGLGPTFGACSATWAAVRACISSRFRVPYRVLFGFEKQTTMKCEMPLLELTRAIKYPHHASLDATKQ